MGGFLAGGGFGSGGAGAASQIYNWQQDVLANNHNLLGVSCVQFNNVAFPTNFMYVCEDNNTNLMVSPDGTVAHGVHWISPAGLVGIGAVNPGNAPLYITTAAGSPIGTINASIACQSNAGVTVFGTGTSSNIFSPGSFFVQTGASLGSLQYEFVVTPNGNVVMGVQASNIADYTSRVPRVFMTMSPNATNQAVPVLWVLNNGGECKVLFESTGGSRARLQLQANNGSWQMAAVGSTDPLYPSGSWVLLNNYTANPLQVLNNGNMGLSITPTHRFQLDIDDAAKPTTNTWTITSDIRTKRNTRPLEGGLSVIRALEPIESEYNGHALTPEGSRVVSFDPEKLSKILPSAVSSVRGKLRREDLEETDIKGVNIHEVIFHLILAVQQQEERIEALTRSHAANPARRASR